MRGFKPKASACLAAVVILIGDIYLNITVWNGWPTGSRGFPFAYETWCDAVPCFDFHLPALAGNVATALVALLILFHFWPARRIYTSEKAALLAFVSTYVWANIQAWFGWRHALWRIPWMPEGGESLLYGFPFVYRTQFEELPLGLFANVIAGSAVLVFIRAVFNRRTRDEAA